MTRIKRRLGGPKEGGYEMDMTFHCKAVDPATLSDLELLEAWKAHKRGACGCKDKKGGAEAP